MRVAARLGKFMQLLKHSDINILLLLLLLIY